FLNKAPKLFGIDEELLKDQMDICLASSKASQSSAQTTVKAASLVPTPAIVLIDAKDQEYPQMSEHVPRIPSNVHPTPDHDLETILSTLPRKAAKKEAAYKYSTFDMDELLGGFNWQVNGDAADLERKLESELQALEAANVHEIIEGEEQADQVIADIDNTLHELETIDKWLLHYTTLLDKMGQDVHSVEVRNKALQVTSTNQKLLLQEIDSIVSKMKLTEPVSQRLKYESLDEPNGIKACERAVTVLMEIVKVKFDDTIAGIMLVKERHGLYNSYATDFAVRFTEFITTLIRTLTENLAKDKTRSQKLHLKMSGIEGVQTKLSNYRNLMNWIKSADTRKHYDIKMNYMDAFSRFYKAEIRGYIENLKHIHTNRKVSPEDQDYIFMTAQVTVTAAATNAISAVMGSKATGISTMTAFRGVANILRKKDELLEETGQTMLGLARVANLKTGPEKNSEEQVLPDEAMGILLKSFISIVISEMNMAMDFLDLSKSSEDEYFEFSHEWLESLSQPREKLNDFRHQNRVNEVYDGIFSVYDDICMFFEWTMKYDQTFTVGMMNHLEDCQKQILPTAYQNLGLQMEMLMTKIVLNFERFVDDQIKEIEETKVTFKKRIGILPCIRTFPKFVDHMEKCVDGRQGQARSSVSSAYARIVKCIFDTLEALAKDHYESAKDSSKGVDDKESLNMHILNIENMHNFHAEIRARKIAGLEQFVKASKTLYDQNLDAYVKIVIRKPLGKILEFFEGVDNLLKSLAPEEVSFHLQFSKLALRDVLNKYPGKEIKKGLDALYKRVEKNFTNEDGSLLQVVWRGIQEACTNSLKRYEVLISLCYPDTGLKVLFTIDDLLGYFSDIAKNH
ncbi:hypothetical protein HDU77_011556, partial [Chytriomyces hyalinus]